MIEIPRYDCEMTHDFYDNSYASMVQYQTGEYVRYEDHIETLNEVTPKPSADLEAFRASIQKDVDWWNSKQGTTCEFSLGFDADLPAKMEILDEFNKHIHGGIWLMHHCNTCKGHSDGARPLHVMIWKTPNYTYEVL